MEVMIKLSEAEMDQVVGAAASATFTLSQTASGTAATVAGTLTDVHDVFNGIVKLVSK
jgi:hypothetical protein